MSLRSVRAQLRLIRTESGGRQGPILSGYRSLVRFEGDPRDFGFELKLEGSALAPGGEATGVLSFWDVDALPPLSPGRRFEVREGARVVGTGIVSEGTPR